VGVGQKSPNGGYNRLGMRESRARHLRSEEDAPKWKMTFPIYTNQTTYVVANSQLKGPFCRYKRTSLRV